MSPPLASPSRWLRLTLLVALALAATLPAAADPPADPPPVGDGFFGFGVQMEERGARLSFVVENSPAEAAGLQPGDLLLTLDGKPLGGLAHDEAHELFAPYDAGQRVSLEVLRDDRVLEFTLTLATAPPERRTSRAALDRYHEMMREHEALEQLLRLVERSSVLLVRHAQDGRLVIRPSAEEADWEDLHPNLVKLLDKHLRGALADLEPPDTLRVRAVKDETGIRLSVLSDGASER